MTNNRPVYIVIDLATVKCILTYNRSFVLYDVIFYWTLYAVSLSLYYNFVNLNDFFNTFAVQYCVAQATFLIHKMFSQSINLPTNLQLKSIFPNILLCPFLFLLFKIYSPLFFSLFTIV